MPYFDQTIQRGIAYDLNVDNAAALQTAITILKSNRRDKVAAAEQLSVAAGVRTILTDTAGPRIDRIIISVHPMNNEGVTVEIKQGAVSFLANCDGDTDIVFDTAP